MTVSNFFIGLLIVFLLAFLIRVFWLEMAIIYFVVKILFWIGILSFFSAIVWVFFIGEYKPGPVEGFWLAWLFFFIAYTLIPVVFYFIASDIFGWIKDIFR